MMKYLFRFKKDVLLNLFQHPTGQAACLVYILHIRLHGVYSAYGVLKQVQHDLLGNRNYANFTALLLIMKLYNLSLITVSHS